MKVPVAAWDAAALVVFVVVGVLTHGASAGAFGRDLACILGGWFAAALVLRLYARGGWWQLAGNVGARHLGGRPRPRGLRRPHRL